MVQFLYSNIEGEGRPFLILHGFLGMSDNWKTLGSQFATQGYQVHMLDLRNHGRSFQSDEFTYELMARDIKSYCEKYNLQNVILLGHSMGGKVAMQISCDFPELVEKLIVADIGPKYYAPHHQLILHALNSVDFSKKPSRKDVDEILKIDIKDFGVRQFLLKSLYWKSQDELAFRFNLKVFNEKINEIGKALDASCVFQKPVLFLRGANSNYILDEDFIAIEHHFKHSEIVTIQNAGHWLHAENPNDFFNAVIEFLKK